MEPRLYTQLTPLNSSTVHDKWMKRYPNYVMYDAPYEGHKLVNHS